MNTATAEKKDQYLGNSVERLDETLAIIKPELSRLKDPVIYDVGGYRFLTERLQREWGFARACDVSSPDLNTHELELEDASADVVLFCEVLEHLWNPDHALKECRRVLKPGGTLVLTTPNLSSWFNRILLVLGYMPLNQDISCQLRYSGRKDIFNKRPYKDAVFNPLFDVHIRLYNLRSLELLLEEWGFSVTASRGYVVSDSTNHKISFPIGTINRICRSFPTLAQGIIVKAVAR
jgi:SAM-dependent methyltransferase